MNINIIFVDNLNLLVENEQVEEPNNEALLEWLEEALNKGFMTRTEICQYLKDRGL